MDPALATTGPIEVRCNGVVFKGFEVDPEPEPRHPFGLPAFLPLLGYLSSVYDREKVLACFGAEPQSPVAAMAHIGSFQDLAERMARRPILLMFDNPRVFYINGDTETYLGPELLRVVSVVIDGKIRQHGFVQTGGTVEGWAELARTMGLDPKVTSAGYVYDAMRRRIELLYQETMYKQRLMDALYAGQQHAQPVKLPEPKEPKRKDLRDCLGVSAPTLKKMLAEAGIDERVQRELLSQESFNVFDLEKLLEVCRTDKFRIPEIATMRLQQVITSLRTQLESRSVFSAQAKSLVRAQNN
jgi:hypothetical protein